MRRRGTPLLIGAVLAFIASLLLHGLSLLNAPHLAPDDALATPMADNPIDMVDLLLAPQSPVALSLMAVLGCGLLYHALRRQDPEAAPAQGPLEVGLLAGAFWPWLELHQPVAALALAGLMLVALLRAALAGLRHDGRGRSSATLAFAAGWATLAGMAMLASVLQYRLGAPPLLAAAISLMLATLLSVNIQLRLGRTISYSIAVIWGLIAIAAGAMLASIGLAAMTVLAIAVIAVALVQAST
jgi:hypothetical protein